MTTATDPGYGVAPPGFRLPAGLRLGTVRLQVSDLARSLEWYRRVLGLQDGSALVELRERRGARPVPRRGRLGLYHFALLLPGRGFLARFVRHLGEIGERAGMSDHLVSEAVYLTDPDGLGIEVYADRPRESWRRNGRQLVMATEPLDLDDLLRAAGTERWTGMPAGTVMGHVHLHVGDLARAEAFYHAGLGLDKVVWGYPGALFLSAGGYHHHLGVNTWAAGAEPAGEDDARLLEWEIVLPDRRVVETALASLEVSGAPVERGPAGGVVRDPWGTTLRLTPPRTGRK
jgi:catechol 2,3-dioxygenase